MSQKAMFITDRTSLQSAKRRAHILDFVIPAHQQLGILAQQNNLTVISGDDLVSPSEYEEYAKLVSNDLYLIEQALKNHAPPDFVSIAIATLTKKLHLFHFFSQLEKTRNIKILNPEIATIKLKISHEYFNLFDLYSCHQIPTADYYLDFQSSSGYKTGIFDLPQNTYSILPQNIIKTLISGKNNFKRGNIITLTIPTKSKNILPTKFYEIRSEFDPKFFEQIERSLVALGMEFHSTYTAFRKYFDGSHLPKAVYFSMVKNPYMAASMYYFKSKNIPIYMQTHGGLLEFGSNTQKYISAKLSEGIYNCPPSASKIYLRSLTQVSSIRNKEKAVLKKNKVSKLIDIQKTQNRKNKVLVALNFTNWGETCWGLSSTCYDTIKVLEHIGKLAVNMPSVLWQIRLKFSVRDVPKKSDKLKLQGLDPETANNIFKGIKNVENVWEQSYEDLLSDCDVVITEGLTSVPFDAWERRKPVIFLKHHDLIRGSHPKPETISKHKSERSTYYVETLESLHIERTNYLLKIHAGLPLTREELRKVICTC